MDTLSSLAFGLQKPTPSDGSAPAATSACHSSRTNAEKRGSVLALLGDPEWSKRSDRRIAQEAAVSHTFVASVRAEQSLMSLLIKPAQATPPGHATCEICGGTFRPACPHHRRCSEDCKLEYLRRRALARRRAKNPQSVRDCEICGRPFAVPPSHPRVPHCGQACRRKARARRAHRSGAAERRNRTSVAARYGLSPADYAALLASQGGRCAICDTTSPGRSGSKHFAIDHDHQTGRVRGLLCNGCNMALGALGDDPARLAAAIAYLAR